jgi:hypothetical protein
MTSTEQPTEEEIEWLETIKPKIHQEIRNFNHQDISKLIQSPLFREFLWIYETKINKKNTFEEDKSILLQLMGRKALTIRRQTIIKEKQKEEELEKRKSAIAAIIKTLKIDFVLKNINNLFFKKENNNNNNNKNISNSTITHSETKSNASTEATTRENNFRKYNSRLFSSKFQTKIQQQLQTRRKVKVRIN